MVDEQRFRFPSGEEFILSSLAELKESYRRIDQRLGDIQQAMTDRLNVGLSNIAAKIDNEVSNLEHRVATHEVQVAVLKVKIGIIGAVAGLVGGGIITVVLQLMVHHA